MDLLTRSPEATQQFAAEFVTHLQGGDVVALKGELGSGKTTFVQGIGQALGIKQLITSPTFVSMQVYDVPDHPTIKTLCHIDSYRFKSRDDAISTGLTDYIGRLDTLCLIEWPENVAELLPPNTIILEFTHLDESSRLIQYPELQKGS